jgi:hypothetical protein
MLGLYVSTPNEGNDEVFPSDTQCVSFFSSEIWATAAPGYPGSLVKDALLYSFANAIAISLQTVTKFIDYHEIS